MLKFLYKVSVQIFIYTAMHILLSDIAIWRFILYIALDIILIDD